MSNLFENFSLDIHCDLTEIDTMLALTVVSLRDNETLLTKWQSGNVKNQTGKQNTTTVRHSFTKTGKHISTVSTFSTE